jgi:phosphoribosylamine--glycine ligase
MNLLVVDQDGVGLDFAIRCSAFGHAVKLFIRRHAGDRDPTGDGLIEKVTDWERWVQWADLIVPTSNIAYLDRFEALRQYGYPIFGPSKESARLEIERSAGMEAFLKHGIDTPPYKTFSSLDDAERHCARHDQRYVFKTLGDEENKALTYAAKSADDMRNRIRRWKKQGMTLKGPCMLQDFIDGVELGVSAWMGSEGFLRPRGENVEHKKLMSGGYGPNTGEMCTLMWYTNRSKLAKQVLDPLEGYLRGIGHRGDIDVNVKIDSKGKAWPLEFTSRLGWPAFYIMCSQHAEPCEWMRDALSGRDTLTVSEAPHIGVVFLQPKKDAIGNVVSGITPANWNDVHLVSVRAGMGVEGGKEKEILLTTGEYVLVVTGSGETVRKARRAVYSTVDQIHVPDVMIRDDAAEEFMESLPELQKLGFATSIEA